VLHRAVKQKNTAATCNHEAVLAVRTIATPRSRRPSSRCATLTSAYTMSVFCMSAARKLSSVPDALRTSYFHFSKQPCAVSQKPKKSDRSRTTTQFLGGIVASDLYKATRSSSRNVRERLLKPMTPRPSRTRLRIGVAVVAALELGANAPPVSPPTTGLLPETQYLNSARGPGPATIVGTAHSFQISRKKTINTTK